MNLNDYKLSVYFDETWKCWRFEAVHKDGHCALLTAGERTAERAWKNGLNDLLHPEPSPFE